MTSLCRQAWATRLGEQHSTFASCVICHQCAYLPVTSWQALPLDLRHRMGH